MEGRNLSSTLRTESVELHLTWDEISPDFAVRTDSGMDIHIERSAGSTANRVLPLPLSSATAEMSPSAIMAIPSPTITTPVLTRTSSSYETAALPSRQPRSPPPGEHEPDGEDNSEGLHLFRYVVDGLWEGPSFDQVAEGVDDMRGVKLVDRSAGSQTRTLSCHDRLLHGGGTTEKENTHRNLLPPLKSVYTSGKSGSGKSKAPSKYNHLRGRQSSHLGLSMPSFAAETATNTKQNSNAHPHSLHHLNDSADSPPPKMLMHHRQSQRCASEIPMETRMESLAEVFHAKGVEIGEYYDVKTSPRPASQRYRRQHRRHGAIPGLDPIPPGGSASQPRKFPSKILSAAQRSFSNLFHSKRRANTSLHTDGPGSNADAGVPSRPPKSFQHQLHR